MKVTIDLSETEIKALLNACIIRANDLIERHKAFTDKTNPDARSILSECEETLSAHRKLLDIVYNIKG